MAPDPGGSGRPGVPPYLLPHLHKLAHYLGFAAEGKISLFQTRHFYKESRRLASDLMTVFEPGDPEWPAVVWAYRAFRLAGRLVVQSEPDRVSMPTRSLDQPLDESDGYNLENNLSHDGPSVSQEAAQAMVMERLRKAVIWLPWRQRLILEHVLGVGGWPLLQQVELSDHFDVSSPRVTQLKQEALETVRERLYGSDVAHLIHLVL